MSFRKPEEWTKELVKDWMREAAETERSYPYVGVRQSNGFWPEVKHDPSEAYGWDDGVVVKCRPTPEQNSRYDFVILWCRLVEKRTAWLLWRFARGENRKQLAYDFSMSRADLYRKITDAHELIAHKLNSGVQWEDVTRRKLMAS